jgi:hypothetical protein
MFNIFVKLLIATPCFRNVKIATTYNMAIGRIEVECVSDIVKLADW